MAGFTLKEFWKEESVLLITTMHTLQSESSRQSRQCLLQQRMYRWCQQISD